MSSSNDQYQRRRPDRRSSDQQDDETNNNNEHQNSSSSSQKYRRRQAAISLASFSSKKGHYRALQEYKKRKETKFLQNASLLREYKKTMKQEGYDVGRGASRKRDNDEMGIAKGGKKRYNDVNNNHE